MEPRPHLKPDKASSNVYISEALTRRAVTATNTVAEKNALHSLAAAMAHAPAEILPKFVELAMTLTGGTAAGLSLFEAGQSAGTFRWLHLHGTLAPFENATTPRYDSPCGVTLDRDKPTLSAHPETIYSWISDAGIVVPEVLLVPLYIDTQEPMGTLWIVSEEEGHFHQGHADTAAELASFAGIALKMVRDEEGLREALGEQELLALEMSHRLKNLFAMTDGMIHGSAHSSENVEEMATSLSGRLHALANAHSLAERRASATGNESLTDLGSLITAIVKVHEFPAEGLTRIALRGPLVPCGERATNSVALIIHELATNAAKYGALSVSNGRVDVDWDVIDGRLKLCWTETGGPPISGVPSRKGFGTRLIEMTTKHQFKGDVHYDWAPKGLVAAIDLNAGHFAC